MTAPLAAAHNRRMRGDAITISGRMLRELVDELVEDGASLARIEREIIEPARLSEDARSALWLYAWGVLQRAAQRSASRA